MLAECFQRQRVQGFDARAFLTPWLIEKSVPRLTTETKGDRVILHEAEPLFILPVTIEATTAKGIERRTIWIREEKTAFSFDGDVSNPQIDPNGLLLLRALRRNSLSTCFSSPLRPFGIERYSYLDKCTRFAYVSISRASHSASLHRRLGKTRHPARRRGLKDFCIGRQPLLVHRTSLLDGS